MNDLTYYRAHLTMLHNGDLQVVFDSFKPIHESRSFVWVVPEYEYPLNRVWRKKRLDGETNLQYAKRCKVPLKRVNKIGSRFAFDNKADAFDNLKARKVLRAGYIRKELNYLERFNKMAYGKPWAEFEKENKPEPVIFSGFPNWS